jgi:hypothetical protein
MLAVAGPPGAVLVVQPVVVAGLDPARDSRHSRKVRARRFAILTTLARRAIALASASEPLLYTQGRASLLESGHSACGVRVRLRVPRRAAPPANAARSDA